MGLRFGWRGGGGIRHTSRVWYKPGGGCVCVCEWPKRGMMNCSGGEEECGIYRSRCWCSTALERDNEAAQECRPKSAPQQGDARLLDYCQLRPSTRAREYIVPRRLYTTTTTTTISFHRIPRKPSAHTHTHTLKHCKTLCVCVSTTTKNPRAAHKTSVSRAAIVSWRCAAAVVCTYPTFNLPAGAFCLCCWSHT